MRTSRFNTRRRHTSRRPVCTAAIEALEVRQLLSLAGSTFESSDGNLTVNTAGNEDWSNAPNLVVALDKTSGGSDDSFSGKEDDPIPSVGTGSIPNNKSDLTRFYVSNETVNINNVGNEFLYLSWERANTLGTADIDFEFNQSPTISSNGITPARTIGDLLISYDLTASGPVTISTRSWTGSQWGNPTTLSANIAEGSINTVTVTDPIAPGAPHSLPAETFGELALNLTAAGIFPANQCVHFGSVYCKSRSSDSFTSSLKDFIAPVTVSISNCPDVAVVKTADNDTISAGDTAGFTVTLTNVGEGLATGVQLDDPLPSGISWVLDQASINEGFSIVNNDLVFGPSSMMPTDVFSAHITGATSAANAGKMTNTATITVANEMADDLDNNQSSASITVLVPDLQVTKTADASPVDAGSQIGFIMSLTNIGQGNAYGVQFTDTLPTGLTWSISPANSDFSIVNGVLIASFSTFAPSASDSVHIIATTSSSNVGTINNTASASATNEPSNLLTNNSASAHVDVNDVDVQIAKTASSANVTNGVPFDYFITVTSVLGASENVVVTDTLDSHLYVNSVTYKIGNGNSVTVPFSSSAITVNLGTLAAGTVNDGTNQAFIDINVTSHDCCGPLSNTAYVSASNEPASHQSDDSSNVIVTAFPGVPGGGTVVGLPFESTDGNLVSSNSSTKADWSTFVNTKNLIVGTDKPSGSGDNAFGQGTKENATLPTIVSGSIPNNKSDLTRFYVATDQVNGDSMVYLGWVRAVNSGSADIDFEFNQSTTFSKNGVTPVRTVNDLLITYDYGGSGTPVIAMHTWQANNTWSAGVALTGTTASAGTNSATSVFDPIANATLAPGCFGEAALDLTQIFTNIPAGQCIDFSTAYVKARSSTSFTAEMKDFIAPINVGIIVFKPSTTAAASLASALASGTTTLDQWEADFRKHSKPTSKHGILDWVDDSLLHPRKHRHHA